MNNAANYGKEFKRFTEDQWNKILSVQHKNHSMEYDSVRKYFVEEILECFQIRGTVEGEIIKEILTQEEIDDSELIDVANLSFAVKIFRSKS